MSTENGTKTSVKSPFVSKWEGRNNLTAQEFLAAFKKYDKDNNGYIEGEEVNAFLEDLMSEKAIDSSDIDGLQAFRDGILKEYDRNKDNKIELAELSKILPKEESFLLQFRLKCSDLTSVEFMKIWKHYDSDCSGYLEKKEIEAFCYDLMSKKKGRRINSKALQEFTAQIIQLYDKNKDGKLELRELQKLMPVEQNYLTKIFEKQKDLTNEEFNVIFDHYDQNQDGSVSQHELSALMRDLILHSGKADSPTNLARMEKDLMKHLDKNKDGKIQRAELSVLFTHKKALKIWK